MTIRTARKRCQLYLGLLENADTDAGQRTPDTGQTMEKTDKRWNRRTNDGKDGQTMETTDAFSNRPTFHEDIYRLKF